MPNFYYNNTTSTLYWNCIFNFSYGYPLDIINVLYDNAIFNESKNLKIVLVISEEDINSKVPALRSTLSHLYELFSNNIDGFKASLSAVFTKQKKYSSDIKDILSFGKRWEISYDILSHLSKNSGLLSFLPHPRKLNLDISNRYPENFREKIVENLNRSTGLSNCQVNIIAIDKLKLHIKELEVSILNEIIGHTKNKVVPELFSFCDNYVMARLKSENIGTIMNAINSLKESLLDIFDNHDFLIFIHKLEDFESSNNIRLNKKILVDACKYAEMIRKKNSNAFTEIDT